MFIKSARNQYRPDPRKSARTSLRRMYEMADASVGPVSGPFQLLFADVDEVIETEKEGFKTNVLEHTIDFQRNGLCAMRNLTVYYDDPTESDEARDARIDNIDKVYKKALVAEAKSYLLSRPPLGRLFRISYQHGAFAFISAKVSEDKSEVDDAGRQVTRRHWLLIGLCTRGGAERIRFLRRLLDFDVHMLRQVVLTDEKDRSENERKELVEVDETNVFQLPLYSKEGKVA